MTRYSWIALVLSAFILAPAAPQPAATRPKLSGTYRPQGLAVQPCGHNEWLRRSFDTDKWCFGSDEGFPFSEQGLANWRAYPPVNDPVLRCIESFPRSAMRGRPMRLTIDGERAEIAYWFNRQWHTRTVRIGGPPPDENTPHSNMGYSVGRWVGDTLVVETSHTDGGPMFNDHKPNSDRARFTERFWLAPDGENLLMDLAIDDPVNYTKPFLLNRQEWISAPGLELSQTECTPSSIWAPAE